ncbi:Uncharacterized protein TCM_024356 [Theobroma cacao]|uniref:Uncharacterized protein n=1 Tax=Theobroma cacao TaxID=3641 RepID=A0A061EW29_THECC|nr:Uncharacterized protein TCM_024356 [Theobroma cacao]
MDYSQFEIGFGKSLMMFWPKFNLFRISYCRLKLMRITFIFLKVLMAFGLENEAVRVSLLHGSPLLTLDIAIQEIIFEETRLDLDKSPQVGHLDILKVIPRTFEGLIAGHVAWPIEPLGHVCHS